MIGQYSSMRSIAQISQISTPRLTPLKMGQTKQFNNISKLDIGALEGKIKAIEGKINSVQLKGLPEERRLNRLGKRLEATATAERTSIFEEHLHGTALLTENDDDLREL